MAKKVNDLEVSVNLEHKTYNEKHMLFEKPEYKITELNESKNYSKFELEPLERGFGNTLGNALRRVLLSSLIGDSIINIKIDKVMHEFQTLEGVIEDVTTIILNLKRVVIKKHVKEEVTIKLSAEGEGAVTASFLEKTPTIEVINKDQVICTLAENGKIDIELTISTGRGYVLAEETKKDLENFKIGTIAMDASFSPVERVNFEVEDARVGQNNNYDKLILEIYTNGSLKPVEALENAASILIVQLQKIDNPEFTENVKGLIKEKIEDPKQKVLETTIDELEFSVRAYNCLKRAGILTVKDLVEMTEDQISKIRNLGKKSLKEIIDKIKELNLDFKEEN